MRGDGRNLSLAKRGQELVALLIVRSREHAAVPVEPFDPLWAVPSLTAFGPARWVGAAEAIHDLLHILDGEVPPLDLDGKNCNVDIAEKVQLHAGDVEHQRRCTAHKRDARLRDVMAAEDARRPIAPVEKPLPLIVTDVPPMVAPEFGR